MQRRTAMSGTETDIDVDWDELWDRQSGAVPLYHARCRCKVKSHGACRLDTTTIWGHSSSRCSVYVAGRGDV
jgi:hypothetical protein